MLVEHPPKIEQQPNLTLPYRPLSPELLREISDIHYSAEDATQCIVNDPAGWSHKDSLKDQPRRDHAFVSVAGRWLYPRLESQGASRYNTPIELSLGLHGYGCPHYKQGTKESNYFAGLSATMGPFYAIDWPGYNTKVERDWHARIEHYPYLLLQLLESFIEKIPPSFLPATNTAPLHFNIVGHSVGARALAVAASINDGAALTQIREKWKKQLGRDVVFQLSLLEPAFGIQVNSTATAVGIAALPGIREMLGFFPDQAMHLIQQLVRTQAGFYGVADSDIYPLHEQLQRNRFKVLASQPSEIAIAPTTRILSASDLRKLGHSLAVITAQDGIVDNEATKNIFTEESGRYEMRPAGWPELVVAVARDHVSITNNGDGRRQRAYSALLLQTSHTPELSHPDVIVQLLRFLHQN